VAPVIEPGVGKGGRTRILPLAAMALGVFVIANDVTALSVALPDIERDFDVRVSTAQWVINAYALVFGVLIVTGGRLADMFGRTRIFYLGSRSSSASRCSGPSPRAPSGSSCAAL
jgi:MFS family permease